MSRRKTYDLHEVIEYGASAARTHVFWTRADADAFIAEAPRREYRGTSRYPRAIAHKLLGGAPPKDLQRIQQQECVTGH